MKPIMLKSFLPEEIKNPIKEEGNDPIDLETKKAFDELMKDVPSQLKTAVDIAQKKTKGKSEDELQKITAAENPLLGKLAKESVMSRKNAIKEDNKNKLNEDFGAAFFAGFALALPAILELLGKLAKKIASKFGRSDALGEKMINAGHKLHGLYKKGLRVALNATLFQMPEIINLDEKSKNTITDILFMVLIAYMAFHGGQVATDALKGLNIGKASIEGAVVAIKSGEVSTWVINTIKDILSTAAKVA